MPFPSEEYSRIKTLINQGRFLEAYTSSKQLHEKDKDDLQACQLYALSLSKTGVPKTAMSFLEPFYKNNSSDPETAGILGGIYKEVFRRTKDSKYAILSRDTYRNNFDETGNYYTGINAATMSAILGQIRKGRELAEKVIEKIGEGNDFWATATLGEAFLLAKNYKKAHDFYIKAKQMAGRDWGKVISVYNQLWLLSHYIAFSSEILRLFEPPTIAAFVGHMVDRQGRLLPRFPEAIAPQVKQAITTEINIFNVGIGYSSVACGGDILFAEAILEAGGEMNVILPFDSEDFLETSVAWAGQDWVDRYHSIMKNSRTKFITTGRYGGNDDLFAFQGRVIFGSAVLRGFRFRKDPYLITVLSDIDQEIKEGGTRHMQGVWPYKKNIVNINPDNFIKPGMVYSNGTPSPQIENTFKKKNRKVLYLISAAIPDATPEKVDKLIGRIWVKIKDFFIRPLVFQKEGNSVVVVFTSTRSSMDFATIVPDMVEEELPDFNFFLGIHAGPVYLEEKTDLGFKKVSGNHVHVAKLIRENATPFSIYTSESFASELSLDSEKYNIEYIGSLETGEENQNQEIYRVEKNTD